ncbi:hypothetical protein DRP53_01875 [candidate division WOR-3 bacterium]|uniref:Core-binding (CB) domain-containing protein n=1 Tax=candidate division WOR-3 bacterium TaxID=2052148 RepID=A0A660SKP2_UNCW3|nr:MAG: hypothetical protein DRP53_01875 [candidate division WOR-3 bacterium]
MEFVDAVKKLFETFEHEPDVKLEWVDKYLKEISKRKGMTPRKLEEIWAYIYLFLFYQNRSEHDDLSKIPWWEYSIALQWLKENVKGWKLNIRTARKMLLTLLDFYKFLVKNGYIDNYQEIMRAVNEIAGGKRLRLLKRIPFTGEELWAIVPGKRGDKIKFKRSDYWLAILYYNNGRSWDKLIEMVDSIPSAEEKLNRINELKKKLELSGYQSPERLFFHKITDQDIEDANRWFFEKFI